MNVVTVDELVADVEGEGFAMWRGYLDRLTLASVRGFASSLAGGAHARQFPKSTRVFDLHRHHQVFVDLLADAPLDAVIERLLGRHYLLSDYSLNSVHPGQPVDDWHIDYPFNEMASIVDGATLGVQCVLALDRFCAENGATRIVPRSHHPVALPDPIEADRGGIAFLAEPGDLLIMAAATWHRSGSNASTASRTAILFNFIEGWIRPMIDPPGEGPWASTERLRILLGMERPPATINRVPL